MSIIYRLGPICIYTHMLDTVNIDRKNTRELAQKLGLCLCFICSQINYKSNLCELFFTSVSYLVVFAIFTLIFKLNTQQLASHVANYFNITIPIQVTVYNSYIASYQANQEYTYTP